MEVSDELKRFVARKLEWEGDEFEDEGKEFRRRIMRATTHRDIVNVLRDAQWDLVSAIKFAREIPRSVPDRNEFREEVAGSIDEFWAT